MHYKSSYIQLLLRIIEVSRTFWSRGHAFRSELASPRHDTIISSPREGGRVALSSATNLFEAVSYTSKGAKFVKPFLYL